MAIPARLKMHLQQEHITYAPVAHTPARSSQYSASLLHIPGECVAKAVVVRSGNRPLIAALPASYHINLEKLAETLGTPVELMREEECSRLFPDCQPGAVPPFGELYGLPVYLDNALAEAPEIIFNAGSLSDGIRMANADFIRLVKPHICSFADRGEPTSKDATRGLYWEQGGGK